MTKAKAKAPATTPVVINGIKGFDKDMKCRGVQFEAGKTYTHDGAVVPCKSGFHAIPDDQHPLAVFAFYPPSTSRFALVELAGETAREGEKIAAQILTVSTEIGFADLVKSAVDFVTARATEKGEHVAGNQGAASSTGYQGAASSTGYQGAASSTGYHSNAMATGFLGRVMGADGCGLYAVERNDNGAITSNACGVVGRDGIVAGVWYCCKDHKLITVAE